MASCPTGDHAAPRDRICIRGQGRCRAGGTFTVWVTCCGALPGRFGSRRRPSRVQRFMRHLREHSAHSQKYRLGTTTTGKPLSARTILSSGGIANSRRRKVPA